MSRYNSNLKHYRSVILIAAVALVLLAVFFTGRNKLLHVDKAELSKFVVDQMSECKTENDNSCYKNMARVFASKYEIKDVLQIFEENEKTPVFFEKCHTALHFLGQEEYRLTKDTKKSLGMGTPICFAGFYHGILEAYLTESGLVNNNEKLAEAAPGLCGAEDNFEIKKIYNECLHGLGHALMFATNGDLPESLKLCDTLGSIEDRNWCYSGAFMENSTSSTNKDHPSKYMKADDLMYPCNILDKKYGEMCYMLQSFYFAEISHYDWKEYERLCSLVPHEFEDECVNAIGQTQVGFTQDPNVMRDNCGLLATKQRRNNCLKGVIGAMGERYGDGWSKVLNFCNYTVSEADKPDCYDLAIMLEHTWLNDKPTEELFCSQINSESAKAKCQTQI